MNDEESLKNKRLKIALFHWKKWYTKGKFKNNHGTSISIQISSILCLFKNLVAFLLHLIILFNISSRTVEFMHKWRISKIWILPWKNSKNGSSFWDNRDYLLFHLFVYFLFSFIILQPFQPESTKEHFSSVLLVFLSKNVRIQRQGHEAADV